MAWYLFLLVVACVAAVFVWDFRRKAARRETASKERFEQIFKENAAAATTTETTSAAGPSTGAAAAPKPSTGVSALPAGERFLGQPQTLVYLLLKTGMPDHHVFANVTLASVVSVTGEGPDREQKLRRLFQCQLDFVVCDRDMRLVAVVDMDAPESRDTAGMQRFKSDCLMAAGVRLIRINPMSLPSRGEMRGLVCGGPDAARK